MVGREAMDSGIRYCFVFKFDNDNIIEFICKSLLAVEK